ncbi:hypothetical protein JTE90_019996 [Oedothorax gibbosus]|uniref:Uncharacterized protein n=1 Tax=Oedothorax gibbosus TaxID=931172 RepID=A0AAV6TPW6_9ARAC|nr:hypothetical protein JTE90_019996 [Oedothorax gibbosus]
MNLLMALTLLKTVWFVSCEVNPFEEYEEAISECNEAFYCKINNPQLVMDVNLSGGPKFTKMIIEWTKEMAHYDVPYDGSVEYFGNYSKHFCALPREEKREINRKYFDVGCEFYMDNCANTKSEECVRFMNYLWENQAAGMKIIAQGHCLEVAKLLPLPEEMKQMAEVTSKAVNAAKNALASVTNIFG